MKENLTSLPDRIEYTGVSLYGAAGWTVALARGLGMSRSQLFEYRIGRGKRDRDIDGELIDLIDRERGAASERGVALTKLRNRLIDLVGKSRKREKRDAAA